MHNQLPKDIEDKILALANTFEDNLRGGVKPEFEESLRKLHEWLAAVHVSESAHSAAKADLLEHLVDCELVHRREVGDNLGVQIRLDEYLQRFADDDQQAAVRRAFAGCALQQGDCFTHIKLDGLIGQGGFGEVWRAHDLNTATDQNREGRAVAIKILKPWGTSDPEQLTERFRSEMCAAMLEHDNVVRVYYADEANARLFYAMEFVNDKSLQDRIDATYKQTDVYNGSGTPDDAIRAQQQSLTSERLQHPIHPRDAAKWILDAARGVAHAHRFGIVHRDIKPANILLRKQPEAGEERALVADFGLAKSLKSKEDSAVSPYIAGTPDYMAPEQFAGVVSTLSDVYSLGAVLYALLTGCPPIQKRSKDESYGDLLRRVRTETPVSPRELADSISRDLDAVCLKSLEKDPQQRYQSALELAQDLDRFLTRRPVEARPAGTIKRVWMWSRRNPLSAATGFTAASLILAFAIGGPFVARYQATLAAEAAQQRDHALENLDLADQAVAKFLTGVSQNPRLRQHDLEDLRTELLREALPILESLTKQAWDDPDLEERRGKAFGRVGDILLYVGSIPEAIEHFRQGVAVLEELVAKQPQVTAYRSSLAVTLKNLGVAYRQNSQHDLAESAYLEACRLSERLVELDAEDADARRILSECYGNLANLHSHLGDFEQAKSAYLRHTDEIRFLAKHWPSRDMYKELLGSALSNYGVFCAQTGQLEESWKSLEEALVVRTALAKKQPAEPVHQQLLAVTLHNLSMFYLESHLVEEAIKASQRAIVIQRELVSSHPTVATYAQDLALSLNNLGTIYADTGDPQQATRSAKDAIDTWDQLVSKHPTVAKFRDELCGSYSNLALLYVNAGRFADAEQTYFKALEVQEQLVNDFSRVPDYLEGLAIIHINLADLYLATHRPQDAEREYREALRIRSLLVETVPAQVDYWHGLVTCHRKLGQFYTEFQRLAEAEESFQDALRAYEALKSRTDSDSCLLAGARIHGAQGNLYYRLQKWEAARDAYRAALEIWDQLARRSPQRTDYRNDRTGLKHNLGLVHAQMQQAQEAEQAMLEALDEWRELAKADPSHPGYQSNVARSYNDLAALAERQQRADEATGYYRQALEKLEALVARHGAAYAVQLGLVYVNLAKILETTGSMAEALDRYGQAIETLRPLVQASPTARQRLINALERRAGCQASQGNYAAAVRDWNAVVEIAPEVDEFRMRRAMSRARAGDHQQAAAEVDELIDNSEPSGGTYYNAACVFAQAATSAAAEQALADRAGADISSKLTARALELLTLAHKAGFFSDPDAISRLQQDPGLDPLRGKAEFQELLELPQEH